MLQTHTLTTGNTSSVTKQLHPNTKSDTRHLEAASPAASTRLVSHITKQQEQKAKDQTSQRHQ